MVGGFACVHAWNNQISYLLAWTDQQPYLTIYNTMSLFSTVHTADDRYELPLVL